MVEVNLCQWKRGIYVGAVEYDESSQAYAMNIGVPIRDPKNQNVIGCYANTSIFPFSCRHLPMWKVGEAGGVTLIDKANHSLFI
ncbi:MAG: hypothetical protein IPO22_24485 [Anaerolineales bacterium]|nr:hypothetical protein [Anaerolineales bacterium]